MGHLKEHPEPSLAIDHDVLGYYMHMFRRFLDANSDSVSYTTFSGNSYLKRNEEYKQRIFSNAQKELEHSDRWTPSDFGKGVPIVREVSAAIECDVNLIDHNQRIHFYNVLKNDVFEAESILFDVYRSDDPEAAFNRFTSMFGKKYDLVSYLFFLKDCSTYLPVRTTFFDHAFEVLGMDFRMSYRCSWENYSYYLETVRYVRDCLANEFGESFNTRLLDAHSFLWMFDLLEEFDAGGEELLSYSMGNVIKDKLATTKARVGQHAFRESLLRYWDGKCSVTGCEDQRLLVSSHIKPWSKCIRHEGRNEWLDPFNGLLLTPGLDKAFDQGLITFGNDGHIVFVSSLDYHDAELAGVSEQMQLRKLDQRHMEYLQYHRENVFKG